jgi:F-type H+-transporting ATPase subunit b
LGEVFGNLGINGPFLLAQTVNFLILFGALSILLWKPLTQRLDERREMLRKEKEEAEAIAETRAEIDQERTRTLNAAREEASQILAEARAEAREVIEETTTDAREQAEDLLVQARQDATEERNRILGEMREEIASLAIAATHQLIGNALDEQRQRALVDSFFSGVREGRVEVLPTTVERVEGPVSVTSAIPLTKEEQAAIREELKPRMEESMEISFKVDPDILGGLLVHAGDQVIDASLAGQLEQLRQTMT